jgi:hypothetical protein
MTTAGCYEDEIAGSGIRCQKSKACKGLSQNDPSYMAAMLNMTATTDGLPSPLARSSSVFPRTIGTLHFWRPQVIAGTLVAIDSIS